MSSVVKRYLWFVFGVILNSFGVALITKAALGTSPISSVPYVLSMEFPLSFGQITFVFNMLFIFLQFALLRRDFHPVQWLQIVVNLLFSSCIDISMSLLGWFDPTNLVSEAVALLLGCAILGLGISIEVAPNVLVVPGEGVVKALTLASGKRFGSVKVAFDVTRVLCACALSVLFGHPLEGLGVGTIVSALLVGRFVNLFNRHLPLIPRIRVLRLQTLAARQAAG